MKTLFSCIWLCTLLACSSKISTTNNTSRGIHSTDNRGNAMLLGTFDKSVLLNEPYKSWFEKNYKDYSIDSVIANQLAPALKDKFIQVFLGTWCGDSKREVPRMIKLLEYCNVKPDQVQLVFVNNHDSAYKQSPFHEEKGKYIFRVPDLLVYDGKKEIGRMVESPVVSLEKDLLQIVKRENYKPQYPAADLLIRHLNDQYTETTDYRIAALVTQLKPLVTYAGELNSLGRILLNDADYKNAIITFRVNAALYPGDVTAKEKLAVALWKNNDLEAAQKCCKEILAMQPNNETAGSILKQIRH